MTHARSGRGQGSITPRSTPPPARPGRAAFARLVGALGLVALTALFYWLLTDEAFTVSDEQVDFRGLAHADEADVRELLADIDRGPNIFRVRASQIVSQLSTLTEVDQASARVTLPAQVTVTLDERDPVFIWSDGATSWLVDEQGMLFAPADLPADSGADAEAGADATEGPAGGTVAGSPRERLPVVNDDRLPTEPPTVGTYLSAIDLAVMRQLLAIDQELLGSRSGEFELRVDDRDGYVLNSLDRAWRALFGHYTLTIQPPDVIPAQVQCLRWLLAAEERDLHEARLAVSDDSCGTFIPIGDDSSRQG